MVLLGLANSGKSTLLADLLMRSLQGRLIPLVRKACAWDDGLWGLRRRLLTYQAQGMEI